MSTVFGDTSFYVALLNPADIWHPKARAISDELDSRVVLTEYVLAELGSALSRRKDRALFVEVIRRLENDDETEIVPASCELFHRGLSLFARRSDKEWSLIDCISFTVMKQRRITTALTADHHFRQAGYTILLD
jgi:uncharacterized protein